MVTPLRPMYVLQCYMERLGIGLKNQVWCVSMMAFTPAKGTIVSAGLYKEVHPYPVTQCSRRVPFPACIEQGKLLSARSALEDSGSQASTHNESRG